MPITGALPAAPVRKTGPIPDESTATLSVGQLALCSTPEARGCLDYETAQQLGALPLGLMPGCGRGILTVAAAPQTPAERQDLLSVLRFAADKEVRLVSVDKQTLSSAIFAAYNGDDSALQIKIERLQASASGKSSRHSFNDLPEFRPKSGEAAQFLASLIDYAIAHNASDLHIIPEQRGTAVKLRIDGSLMSHKGTICPLNCHQQIIARLKVLSALDSTARLMPQDGALCVPLYGRAVHARLSIMPTIHGEKAVLRFACSHGPIELGRLGLDQRTCAALEAFMQRREGAALFCGATGSGKTTTMYALMQQLTSKNLGLVSIEDPVEVHMNGVAQTSLNEKLGLDYAACLRSVLRQDPDVILLGEIRDEQSAKIAFQAALTGHLMLSTVHARNVFEVFLRLANLEVDNIMLAQAVNLVVCQKLLARLCDGCKVFDLEGSERVGSEIYKPVGCRQCGYSGYSGRVLAVESLSLDRPLSNWLLQGERQLSCMRALCNSGNYSSLNTALARLVKEGKLSLSQLEQAVEC